MKTTVSIPDKLFRSAEALARRLDMSRSELYIAAIAEFLSRHDGQPVTDRLNAVYQKEDSSLSPGVVQLQARSLPRDEW